MTTCTPANRVQQKFSLTLSICKHSPQLDTFAGCALHTVEGRFMFKRSRVCSSLDHGCGTSNRSKLYTSFDLALNYAVYSLWTPRHRLTRNSRRESKRKKRERAWACFCLLTLRSWNMIDVMSRETLYFLRVSAEWWVAVVAGLNCSNSRQRVKEFQWAVGLAQQPTPRRPRKILRKIFFRVIRQNPICVDRLLLQTQALVRNSFFTCCVTLLPVACRCQSNGGGGVCLWDLMTRWIPTCVAIN